MESNWKNLITAIILAFLLCITTNVQAKDFGVIGHTYEIKEQDILEYIKNKLQRVDLDALKQKAQSILKKNVERPKSVEGITNVKEDRSYFFDPTFILDEDVRDHRGMLIHGKGTKINPLEKTPLSNALIFIDGGEEAQVEYALKEQSKLKGKAKIILVKGAPLKLQKNHKTWMYFDQFGFLTSKLGIKHVPAIVVQDALKLRINEIALK